MFATMMITELCFTDLHQHISCLHGYDTYSWASFLPRLLMMRPPHQKSVNVPRLCIQTNHGAVLQQVSVQRSSITEVSRNCTGGQPPKVPVQWSDSLSIDTNCVSRNRNSPRSFGLMGSFQPVVKHAMFGINFISEHVKQQDEFQRVSSNW